MTAIDPSASDRGDDTMPPHHVTQELFPTRPPGKPPAAPRGRALRIGVGGPVGSGKTTLVGALCRALRDELSVVVVTNDIFTTEDAQALRASGALAADRITAVETGCCPHTAIRDDIAANLDAVERLERRHDPVDLTLVESGGDNLTAIFSTGLIDAQIFVIDTAGGDDVPRKGGPGITMADLLVINKTDLAPYVGSDVGQMRADAARTRDDRPVIATSLADDGGVAPVVSWIAELLAARPHR
jgi:urease accessory protein